MREREVRLHHQAGTVVEFINWARGATYGDFCVYHEGSLSADRVGNDELEQIANTVLLLQDTGFLIATQFRRNVGDPTKYIATRTGRGYAPRAVMKREITAGQWRILHAVRDVRHGRSITRVIRDTLSTSSDRAAAAVFESMKEAGWIEEDPSVLGWKISRDGLSLLM